MPDIKGERSIVIQASAASIHTYISDFPKHTEWNHQPQEMTRLSEGPIVVGSRFRTQEQPPRDLPWFMANIMFPLMSMITGAKGYTEAEITVMDHPHRLAWQAEAPTRNGFLMKADWEIVLETQGQGTQVTQRFHFKPQHPLTKRAVNDALGEQIKDEVAANLILLKKIVEKQ